MLNEKFNAILDKMDKINHITNNCSNKSISSFFEKISIKVDFASSEAGFMKLISFFYAFINEGDSKINYKFIVDKCASYHGNVSILREFKKNILDFRTVLQHSLNLNSNTDTNKLYNYQDWLKAVVNKCDGLSDEEWSICCNELLKDTNSILDEIQNTINQINSLSEEFKIIVIEDWIGKLTSEYPIYRYKDLTSIACEKFACSYLDINRFCQKHYSDWKNELLKLDQFDFNEYATRQVERDLHSDMVNGNFPLPINANDIMDFLNISPGKQLAEYLQKAKDYYKNTPCSKQQLLEALATKT